MKKLLIATHNPGKLHELAGLLRDLSVELASLSNVGIAEDIEEDGTTYEENSQKKALFYAKKSGLPSLSDDGGLEIAALDNAPGIHSKRWLGEGTTEEDLIAHMQKIAQELPEDNRNARFRAALSLALPNGKVWSVMGEVNGIIAKKQSLNTIKGFPYRSFFYLPELKKYYFETELTREEQLKYNHRVKAIEKLKPILQRELAAFYLSSF
ncbi:MAG TPA: non-canonical purine NTP pyrophosphatase [Methylomirabilota bacterium]|nr:non-canonical purine NTP pyrophosphatase [Methylomirabilota bacterium]